MPPDHKPVSIDGRYRCDVCGRPLVQVTRYRVRFEGTREIHEPRTWWQHAAGKG